MLKLVSLSVLLRPALAAATLAALSSPATATVFSSAQPYPQGAVVDMQAAGHAAFAIPGLGASATDIILNNFALSSATQVTTGVVYRYTATLQIYDGSTPIGPALDSTDFAVELQGQAQAGAVGSYVETLLAASFAAGNYVAQLDPGQVSGGSVGITALPGGLFDITNTKTIYAQCGTLSGGFSNLPTLFSSLSNGSSGGGVPEPGTALLWIPGLALLARRRAVLQRVGVDRA